MTPEDTPVVAVFGAGGFLLQMLPALDTLRHAGHKVIVVDDRSLPPVFGYRVVPLDHVPAGVPFVIAVAGGHTRALIVDRLGDRRFIQIAAASALVSSHSAIAPGAILCDNFVVEAGSRIGYHFHGNLFSYVAHECVIGDFVTFAPRVSCNGNVHIGDHAYIGTGAVIRQGTPERPLRIGNRAVIGMGAVVTKDVPDDATVVGNPARPR